MMDKVRKYISDNGMIAPGDRLIAGVSGGADSVCLFYVLRALEEALSFSFTVVHVEHGIRGEEAMRDAAFVEELCQTAGVPCRVVHVDVPALAAREGLGWEEAGRLARRRVFEEAAKAEGAARIALAHQLNDRAETLLFNLARGTGLPGLGSIRPVNGPYIRPLLGVTREEIIAYLRGRGALWQEDSTNQLLDMSRNRLRHDILPSLKAHVNSRVNENMARAAALSAEAWDYMEGVIGDCFRRDCRREGDETSIAVRLFLEEKPVIAKGVVRMALWDLLGSGKDLSARHVETVLDLFAGKTGRLADLPGGLGARRTVEGVLISRRTESRLADLPGGRKNSGTCEEVLIFRRTEDGEAGEAPCLAIPGRTSFNGWLLETTLIAPASGADLEKHISLARQKDFTKCFDYDKIKGAMRVRTRRMGDYLVIHPDGRRKSVSDLFTDQKLPAGKRDRVPCVAIGSDVLWAVGVRSGEGCRIGPATRRILMVSAQRQGTEKTEGR